MLYTCKQDAPSGQAARAHRTAHSPSLLTTSPVATHGQTAAGDTESVHFLWSSCESATRPACLSEGGESLSVSLSPCAVAGHQDLLITPQAGSTVAIFVPLNTKASWLQSAAGLKLSPILKLTSSQATPPLLGSTRPLQTGKGFPYRTGVTETQLWLFLKLCTLMTAIKTPFI